MSSDNRGSNIYDFPGPSMPSEPPLYSGGGGGTSGGMEPRIARLEADMDHVKTGLADVRAEVKTLSDRVGRVEISVATLTERVAHLPGKGFIVTCTSTMVILFTAFFILGDKIKIALGL